MSGLEIAGIVLGAFPLIISALEHWRDVAKVGGFYWRIRTEYTNSRRDVLYHEILYRRNLKELLLPIVDEPNDVVRLTSNPGGKEWKTQTMQARLKQRLQESYDLYMEIIEELEETAGCFQKELAIKDDSIQAKLSPPHVKAHQRSNSPQPLDNPSRLASAKAKWDYEKFRIKFSFNEVVRADLVRRLEKCNQRLRELLRTSDAVPACADSTGRDKKQDSELEKALKRSRTRSKLLFAAIQRSWHCACQPDHYAHLRLEHRKQAGTCFEIILTSVSAFHSSWSWKELRCDDLTTCAAFPSINADGSKYTTTQLSPPVSQPLRSKRVAFAQPSLTSPEPPTTQTRPDVDLCRTLGMEKCPECVGVLSQDEERYHLHKSKKRREPGTDDVMTLEKVIADRTLARDQRYHVALLLASSVAQLQETPWLTKSLKKEDVFFYPCEDDNCGMFHHEPFIRQGFVQPDRNADEGKEDCNFYSLGILLLELCFAQRLEDHPYRKRYSVGTGKEKEAFDRVAALDWSHEVLGEGGHEYASAVSWCFLNKRDQTQTWQNAIIRNVIRPLEVCQEHFKAVVVT